MGAWKGWDWPAFDHLLPASILIRMVSIVLSNEEGAEDKLIWRNDKSGVFSVGSAYRAISVRSSQEEWLGWGKIKRLPVQQRVTIFVWLLAHDRLVSNYNRWRRRLTGSPLCTLCEEREESCLHAICDC